jgi:hypothetical protein
MLPSLSPLLPALASLLDSQSGAAVFLAFAHAAAGSFAGTLFVGDMIELRPFAGVKPISGFPLAEFGLWSSKSA